MINNRQNGRRRGRGPQVRGGPGGGQDRGNRIDNRARGNAAQLHEKYRNLARDTQTQGDRVMTEYYLQFADHYFRVLSESRARFEEQNPNAQQRRPQGDQRDDGDFYDAGDQDEGEEGYEGERYDRRPQQQPQQPQAQQRYDRQERPERQDRQDRQEFADRPERQDRVVRQERPDRAERQDRVERVREPQPSVAAAPVPPASVEAVVDDEALRPRRRGRPRRTDSASQDAQPQRIEIDRLPPAFSADPAPAANGHANDGAQSDAPDATAEEAPKRRRTRRVKDDGDSVAA